MFLLVYLTVAEQPKVCMTASCVRTSMDLLSYIDPNADPCTDFYRFACGSFLSRPTIEDTSPQSAQQQAEEAIKVQIQSILIENNDQRLDAEVAQVVPALDMARKFYRACMNESAIEVETPRKIRDIFKQIGGWPTINPNNWRGDLFDWKEAVYRLKQTGINFEFFLILSLETGKSDGYFLSIKDPAYGPSQISTNIKTLYLNFMVDVAVLIGANKNRARTDQNEVMQFMLKLAKISEEAQTANGTRPYNPLSLSELQYAFPDIPWQEYINKVLAPVAQITYDDIINVPDPVYLKKLFDLIKHTSKRIIANFISWHILQRTINYLPTKILDRAYEYLGKVNGKITRQPRWSMCVDTVESRMSPVISAAFIHRYVDATSRQYAIATIRHIKRQFRANLQNLNWLDEKTKDIAGEKVVSSVEDIASFHALCDAARRYEKVEIFENKLLESALNLEYIQTNIQYEKIHQPIIDDYFEKSHSVTGLKMIYVSNENAIKIPLGLLQGMFYQKERPNYLNYGTLGAVIAHEIYHIITEAEYKNYKGDLRSWWSSLSLVNYDVKLNCLSNQYGKLILNKIEKRQRLNVSNTRDKDMADLAGVKVAYDAYKNYVQENGVESQLPGLNFSPNQLFWISSAIHHCAKYSNENLQRYIANYHLSPGQFRVNGPLQNLEDFANDFACAPRTAMNPHQKCHIW